MDEHECGAERGCPVEFHAGHCLAVEPGRPWYQRFTDPVVDAFVTVRIAFGMRFERFRRRITGFNAGD